MSQSTTTEHRTTQDFAADLDGLISAGYRVLQISPADDPSAALLVKGVERVHLIAERSEVELRSVNAAPIMPLSKAEFEISHLRDHPDFGDGRAGMAYRDLVPSRQGGRIIASHIHIADAGPVADYVHFHNICFQMIYVHSGWVRLVYEDQGDPFVMSAGDCVLQPPHIRHQVLESSANLQVIEVAAPASHDTFADFDLELPTSHLDPDRDFTGQRFWLHKAADATWKPGPYEGFETCDLGLLEASGGAAGVYVHRSASPVTGVATSIECESQLIVLLEGDLQLRHDERTDQLSPQDCFVLPGGQHHQFDSTEPTKFLTVNFVGLP